MSSINKSTTSLSDIRTFLVDENAAPPPWCKPGTLIESLYSLLEERQNDDLFWQKLKNLVDCLEDSRINHNGFREMEVLDGATLSRLLDDLRDQVGSHCGTKRNRMEKLGSTLSMTALSGLLLLGLATACDSDDGGTCLETAEQEHGFNEDRAEVYCEIVDYINGADISGSDRSDLLECMPELDEWEHLYLLDQFQNASDDEISTILEDLLDPCNMCDPDMSSCH